MKFIPRRNKKRGLPPGTPVHVGKQRHEPTRITLVDYDEATIQMMPVEDVSVCVPLKELPTVTWLHVEGVHNLAPIQQLGECFGLHALVLEDIMNTEQRPKVEAFDDYLYIVLKLMTYDTQKEEVQSEQVSLIVGHNFVLSFEEGPLNDVFSTVRDRIQHNRGRIKKMEADYLAYSLIDAIVDHYFVVLEYYGEAIEEIEDALLDQPSHEIVQDIQHLRREMIYLRKSVWPLREILGHLERGESNLIRESTYVYLRDVYDHTIQVIDTVETYRDMLSSLQDIYLSSISNHMNEVMKTLTIFASIFIPLTFVVGVYGMNFENMPELKWYWSYPALWGLMVIMGGGMLVYFRRKGWF